MGIESINSQPTRNTEGVAEQAAVQRTERARQGGQPKGVDAAGGDTLEVSARGRELAKAQQAVDAAPGRAGRQGGRDQAAHRGRHLPRAGGRARAQAAWGQVA